MAMMLEKIPMGVYIPGDTPIHRLQARTKLLILVWCVVWIVLADHRFWHFVPYIMLCCLALGAVLLARLSFAALWRRMWLIVVLVGLSALGLLFQHSGTNDTTLFSAGPWFAPTDGLRNLLITIAVAAGLVFMCSFTRLLPARRMRRWRGIFLLVVLAALVGLLVLSGMSSSQVKLGPLVIAYYGVWTAVTVTVILLVLFMLSLILTMTTSPAALIEGLSMLLSPLRKLKLPVDDFALMALLALRFMPTLVEEVAQLMKAQSARGSDMLRGTLSERMHSLTILFIALVQNVLRRATELATALDARGYRSTKKQTPLYETSFAAIDYATLGIVLVLSIGSLLL